MDKEYLPLEKFGISNINQLNHIKLNRYKELNGFSGVYLFYFKGSPIYIGKTESMRSRIESHIRSNRFNKYIGKFSYIKLYWIKNETRKILEIERILIRYFKPPLNINGIHDPMAYLMMRLP